MRIPAYSAPEARSFDIVIVGGAVIGSSVAYWLTEMGFDGSILVVERDSTYEFSSTALSTSAIRQQYSNPINVKISQFGIEFIRSFQERMQPFCDPGEQAANLGFREHGYLYCVSPDGVAAARERVELQQSLGAGTVFLEPGPLKDRFPWLNVEDLGGGAWGSRDEGWFDSVGLMMGFRRGARARGAVYIDNEVTDVSREGDRITGVTLKTGERIACGLLVNAAGARAQKIAGMAGLSIPVEPRKRHSFVFSCATPIAGRMPNVIDMNGTFVRPEHALFLTGNTPTPDGPADYEDFETKHDEFDDYIWPTLWNRIPQFEAIKVQQFWTGHYAFNTLDHNAILGPHSAVRNFLFANGFSGHGLQQSPAVGRGLAELILFDGYRSLDLSPLSYERIERNEPFLEAAVI